MDPSVRPICAVAPGGSLLVSLLFPLTLISPPFLGPFFLPFFVLLSAARPTSPASDQTKGGVGRVYRDTEARCRERKIRSDEDTALIQN